MIAENYLVPGRECGSCTACCTEIAIEGGGIDKPAGVSCRHLVDGKRFGIYATRPNLCRDFHCMWRSLDNVGEEWRPDRSGILMRLSSVSDDHEQFGVELILIGDPEVLVSDGFASLVGGFIESCTATHLLVPMGPDFFIPIALLNDVLRPAIAARNLAAVKRLLASCYRELVAMPHTPIPFGQRGSLEASSEAAPAGR